MLLTHFLRHADRDNRHRARVVAGLRAPDPVYDHRVRPWGGERPLTFFRPDTPHCRARRFIDVGADFMAALAIIAGGAVLTGLATLL